MKQVMVVVKPFKAQNVLEALADMDVHALIVRDARGYGQQISYLDRTGAGDFTRTFVPKVEIVFWVEDTLVEHCLQRIIEIARTGRVGDGKIFVLDTAWDRVLEF